MSAINPNNVPKLKTINKLRTRIAPPISHVAFVLSVFNSSCAQETGTSSSEIEDVNAAITMSTKKAVPKTTPIPPIVSNIAGNTAKTRSPELIN